MYIPDVIVRHHRKVNGCRSLPRNSEKSFPDKLIRHFRGRAKTTMITQQL